MPWVTNLDTIELVVLMLEVGTIVITVRSDHLPLTNAVGEGVVGHSIWKPCKKS